MRPIKLLVLAGVIALAAMAFVGTGAASADSACTIDPLNGAQGECPEESIWMAPILGLAPVAVFRVGETEIKCKSEFLAEWVENEGKKTGVRYLVLSWTFAGCDPPGCKVTAENLPYSLLAEMWLVERLRLSEDKKGRPAFYLEKCEIDGVALNCLYETQQEAQAIYALESKIIEKIEVPLVGAIPWNIPLLLGEGSKLCDEDARLEAKYLLYEEAGKEGPEIFFTAAP